MVYIRALPVLGTIYRFYVLAILTSRWFGSWTRRGDTFEFKASTLISLVHYLFAWFTFGHYRFWAQFIDAIRVIAVTIVLFYSQLFTHWIARIRFFWLHT